MWISNFQVWIMLSATRHIRSAAEQRSFCEHGGEEGLWLPCLLVAWTAKGTHVALDHSLTSKTWRRNRTSQRATVECWSGST